MNERLHLFKYLSVAMLLAAHIAFAADAQPSKAEVKKNKTLWSRLVKSIKGAKLRHRISVPTVELYRGINLGGSFKESSVPSVANHYSGIDVWEVNASLDSRIFNYELPVNVRTSAAKKITYIQQFTNRKDSILRVPYDPITKIPRSAQDFYRQDENGEYIFKPGDFIGYRLPLVFGISASTMKTLLSNFHANIGYHYFMSGEFDIQVFRMSNSHIRLKIIAVNDKSRGWSAGTKVFGFDPLTSMIVDKLLDDRIYTGVWIDRTTDLYLGDYILNLESFEARELYDSIVAQKMKIFNVDMAREYLSTSQFLNDRRQFNKNLFADLQQFNALAAADKNLRVDQKRVIKIINAENHTEAGEETHGFNFFRLIKYSDNENDSNAQIAIVENQIKNKDNYFLHSVGENSKFSITSNWNSEKKKQLNLLFKLDANESKTEIVGIHSAKSRYRYSLSKKEYREFFEKTAQHLPAAIKKIIKFPHEIADLRKRYNNTYLNFEAYITNSVFTLNQNLTPQIIYQRLAKLLESIKSLEEEISIHEKHELAVALAEIFSNEINLDDKYKILNNLMNDELFSNFGLIILINVLNPETLSECVLVELSYSGTEIDSKVMKYPSETEFNRINLFKNIIEQNNYILDRSYNLRNFLKEDGTPYSLEELILKNEFMMGKYSPLK